MFLAPADAIRPASFAPWRSASAVLTLLLLGACATGPLAGFGLGGDAASNPVPPPVEAPPGETPPAPARRRSTRSIPEMRGAAPPAPHRRGWAAATAS